MILMGLTLTHRAIKVLVRRVKHVKLNSKSVVTWLKCVLFMTYIRYVGKCVKCVMEWLCLSRLAQWSGRSLKMSVTHVTHVTLTVVTCTGCVIPLKCRQCVLTLVICPTTLSAPCVTPHAMYPRSLAWWRSSSMKRRWRSCRAPWTRPTRTPCWRRYDSSLLSASYRPTGKSRFVVLSLIF